MNRSWAAIAVSLLSVSAPGQTRGGGGEAKPAPAPATPIAVDHLSGTPDFIADNTGGSASALIRICNKSESAITLNLNVSDFRAESGERLGTDAAVFQPAITSVAAKKGNEPSCAVTRITVGKLWVVGSSSAQLLNGKDSIATLTANRERAPFGVKLEGGEKPEIHFIRASALFGQGPTKIQLRNDDPLPYRFRLHVEIDGRNCDTNPPLGTRDIRASSGVEVTVRCEDSLFDFARTGMLKPDSRPGTAVIEFLSYDSRTVVGTKRQPLTASLYWFPEYYELTANVMASIVFLLLGALTAVVVTLLVPNRLRKRALKDRLQCIRSNLNGVHPPEIAKQTHLLLILERSRLDALRRNCTVYSLDANATLTQVQLSTLALERTTAVFIRLCRVLLSADDPTSLQYPPSVLSRVRQTCRDAFTLLQLMPLSDVDAATVEQSTRDAEKLLVSDGQVLDWLETQIRGVEQTIQQLLCDAGPPKKPKATLPAPWERLQAMNSAALADVELWDTMSLFPGQYALRDRRALLLLLFHRVSTLDAIVPLQTPAERKQVFEEFVQKCAAPADLVALQQLVTELEQACYESNIVAALGSKPVTIVPEGDVLSYSPIGLQIVFPNEPKLNGAAAQARIGVEWKFGDDTLAGTGWRVWHYFISRGASYSVTATFTASNGKSIPGKDGTPASATATISARNIPEEFRHRNKRLEVIRFLLVLLTATFGIQAARQLLPTADVFSAIIGIFALGFGATTMRSLLSSSS